jgi:hypothetical protein
LSSQVFLLSRGLTSTFENHGVAQRRKKKDSLTYESNPNADILSNTTSRLTNVIKSWKQVYEILEQEISLCSNDSAEEGDKTFLAKLRYVAKSELHRVASQPKPIPYTDMISWALEHVDIPMRTICNDQKTIIDSRTFK